MLDRVDEHAHRNGEARRKQAAQEQHRPPCDGERQVGPVQDREELPLLPVAQLGKGLRKLALCKRALRKPVGNLAAYADKSDPRGSQGYNGDMAEKFTATSSTTINAAPEEIWTVLTDPSTVSKAFFGAKVDTDWRVGSAITWTGEWKGKPFRDHGEV